MLFQLCRFSMQSGLQFIGSFSSSTNTWLWAWANFSILEPLREGVKNVRDLGDANRFPRLTTPKWKATEEDGWQMAAVAAQAMGALGVYRVPTSYGFAFIAIMSASRPS